MIPATVPQDESRKNFSALEMAPIKYFVLNHSYLQKGRDVMNIQRYGKYPHYSHP